MVLIMSPAFAVAQARPSVAETSPPHWKDTPGKDWLAGL